jgi:hypothetical protein
MAIYFTGYLSDESDDCSNHSDSPSDEDPWPPDSGLSIQSTHKCLPAVPPLKCRKLDIPFHVQRKLDNERREDERRTAFGTAAMELSTN